MKLRNKKTGEIWDIAKIITNDNPSYDTLESINEDFEDYKEPLIKDKRIRKAVRAWAEANEIEENNCYSTKTLEFNRAEHRLQWIDVSIEFNDPECLENLENGRKYTIIELCGEE